MRGGRSRARALPTLVPRWTSLLTRLGLDPGAPVVVRAWDTLIAAYTQPTRHYHNLDHIAACLGWLERPGGRAPAPELLLATWFHDLVYEPGATDNELTSARSAGAWMARWELSAKAQRRVAGLIAYTADHEAPPDDVMAWRLLDADLAILGAPAPAYDRYSRAVRREYVRFDDATFRAGRSAVLSQLLARERLYRSDLLPAGREHRAQANLRRELAALNR